MFKKFNEVSNITLMDNKSLKEFKKNLIKDFPILEEHYNQIIPKKAKIQVARPKIEDKSELLCVNDEIIFFKYWNKWIPTLKFVHKYPGILKEIQVDKGAIKHVLNGADIMSPGLTSEGGKLSEVNEKDIVIVKAEGKEIPLTIGSMLKSSKDILQNPNGMAVKNLNHIGDGLWFLRGLKK